jgi:hypothetical protein
LPRVDLGKEWKDSSFLKGMRENVCIRVLTKEGAMIMEPFDMYEWLLSKVVMLLCTIWHNAILGDMSGLSYLIGEPVDLKPIPIK